MASASMKKNDDVVKASPPALLVGTRTFVAGIAKGVVFGVALEKSKVYLPAAIMDQMLFRNFTMVKMFLTASAVGTGVMALLRRYGYSLEPVKPRRLGLGVMGGFGGTIVGGVLLGVGMTLTGACPGTVLAQFGAQLPTAIYTLAGGVFGALSFGYWQNKVTAASGGAFHSDAGGDANNRHKLETHTGLSSAWTAALLMSSFALVNYTLEHFFPWQADTNAVLAAYGASPIAATSPAVPQPPAIADGAWSPYFGGTVIGLLQLPAILLSGKALGSSSAYVTIAGFVSSLFDSKQSERAPYFKKYVSIESLWQVGLIGGMVVGSFLSATSSGFAAAVTSNAATSAAAQVSPLQAFLGGAVMITGARISSGCTSGHGLSGIAKLGAASLAAVVAMFAGGIATAHLMQ